MSTTIRMAVISTLALLALLVIPSTRADGVTFDITGQTATVVCQAFNEPCQQVSYHLIANTVPWHPDGYDLPMYLITSLRGTVNGDRVTGLAPNVDPLLTNQGSPFGGWGNIEGPVPFEPGLPDYLYPPLSTDLRFLIDGQQYTIGFDDMITVAMGLGGPEFGAPVSWDADVVSVPEPSSGLLFLTGLGLLGGVIFLRKV